MTTYAFQSAPASGTGAIAVVRVTGDIEPFLSNLGVRTIGQNRTGLREIPGVDTVVVARVSETAILIFPHAGDAVARRVRDALERAGAAPAPDGPAETVYPEAADAVEARMLGALARAESTIAVDLLLDQPRRWREPGASRRAMPDLEGRLLRRLIDPPVVVAMGPPNVGKSSLLNALAGRSVAIVADEPGTTRDHVGVRLDLAGLVVQYLDTPGLGRAEHDPIQQEAQTLARGAAWAGDLILFCGDANSGFLDPEAAPPRVDLIRVGLRADLDEAVGADLSVSAKTGRGMDALVRAARDRLVPPALLADPRPWRFWDEHGPDRRGPGAALES